MRRLFWRREAERGCTAIYPSSIWIFGGSRFYIITESIGRKLVDDIVLVTGVGWQEYCQNEIVKKYGLKKVRSIVPGGAQRYDSYTGGLRETEGADYIYILMEPGRS